MNRDFGPGLGVSSSPLMGADNSHSTNGLNIQRCHTSSHGSYQSDHIQSHPSHYGHPRPNATPGPVGTIAPKENKWMIPLCHEPQDDANTCCLGFWCPQILYGRTQFRLRQMAQNKDPLDLNDYKVVNGPCATFMLVEYVTDFSWIFIMLQHSRIRATYNIDGTTADDCFSAYCCPCCTVMQDDREIRARECKDGKNKKGRDTINDQPTTQPDMQYANPHLFGDEPVQHRGSLIRENPTTTATGYSQSSRGHGPKGVDQGHEHSQHHHEHNILHKSSDMNEHNSNEKGKIAHHNHQRGISNNGSAFTNPPAYPDHEERDAIIASRQKWRHQNVTGRQEGCPVHVSAECQGDGASRIENRHPAPKCRTRFDYSEDASISQFRGRRVLKQLTKLEDSPKDSNLFESPADESVLVFYEDGERPQRHSLADCARLRASTLGRTDTPHHNSLPTVWHEEKTVGGHGQPKPRGAYDLPAHPEVVVTEDLKPLNPQHILSDCHVEDVNQATDVKQHNFETQSLENCIADAGPTSTEAAEAAADYPSSAERHILRDCANDAIPIVAKPKLAEKVSQHSLLQCGEADTEPGPVESNALDQHSIAGCAVVDDARSICQLSLDQHTLADCDTIVNDTQSEASEDIYSADNHPRSKPAAEQSESHSVTITVPQPPEIIITTSEVFEEATGERHDRSRSKSAEIVVIPNDPTTLGGHQARPSNQTRDHDGTTDVKDGQQQLSEAADALRKVLRAAADVRHGKNTTDFKGNGPTEVSADSTPKKSSHRSRTKAIGGRAQETKGK